MCAVYSQPNEHGVYLPDQCEVITFEGRKGTARIMLAHIGPDEWAVSPSVTLASRFWGGYPSVNRNNLYPSRQDALMSAVNKIIADCASSRRTPSTHADAQARREVTNWAESQKQLSLF